MEVRLILVFGVLVVVAAVAAVVIGAVDRRDARRGRCYEDFACERGWRHVPQGDRWWNRFSGTPFGVGYDEQAYDVFRGDHRGRNFVAFGYSYIRVWRIGLWPVTEEIKFRIRYRFAVVVIDPPTWCPLLQITHENYATKLGRHIGLGDVELESAEFNDKFRITVQDNRFAYNMLAPLTMQWMLADERFARWPLRFDGPDLLTWKQVARSWALLSRSCGAVRPETITPKLDWLTEVLDRAPRLAWANHPNSRRQDTPSPASKTPTAVRDPGNGF